MWYYETFEISMVVLYVLTAYDFQYNLWLEKVKYRVVCLELFHVFKKEETYPCVSNFHKDAQEVI